MAQYNNLKAQLEHYETRTNTPLTFAKLSEYQYWDIFDKINKRNQDNKGDSIKHKTIAKICKHLRAILEDAKNKDIEIGFKWDDNDFKVKTENNTALDEKQLLEIYNTDTAHSKEFTNARNFILFSSLTALRIGDMVELHKCQEKSIK